MEKLMQKLKKSLATIQRYMTFQHINLYASLACLALFGFAAYLQFVHSMEPCPLCILQRLIVVLVGLVFFAGIFLRPTMRKAMFLQSICGVVFSVFGMLLSARHMWLQYNADSTSASCGPSLDYMLEHFPLVDVVRTMIKGGGHCHKINWELLGLTIPEWTFSFFVFFAVIGLFNAWRAMRH